MFFSFTCRKFPRKLFYQNFYLHFICQHEVSWLLHVCWCVPMIYPSFHVKFILLRLWAAQIFNFLITLQYCLGRSSSFFSHHLTEWLVSVYFSYMNTMLIVQFMWSLGLACVDMYSIRNKKDLHNSLVVTLVVIGDWVGHLLYILCCPCSYVWKHALRQFNPKFCSVVVLKTSFSNGKS
jgi:hypothetical protein